MGLDDLPGFDRVSGTFRFTRDHAKLRDAQGRSLGVLGRAHPLVRRAVAQAQGLADETTDCRVATARADTEGAAVLLTYNIELRSAARVELQRAIAVLLPECGEVVELEKYEHWLSYAEPARALALAGAWQQLFAHWVPRRECEARSVARAAMQREADRCTSRLHQRTMSEEVELQEWLRRRAEDICGTYEPVTRDLFDAAPRGANWRLMAAPLDRLAGFAGDANNPPVRRQEAHRVVELFRRRSADLAAYVDLATPMLHPIGMLMLVPASRA